MDATLPERRRLAAARTGQRLTQSRSAQGHAHPAVPGQGHAPIRLSRSLAGCWARLHGCFWAAVLVTLAAAQRHAQALERLEPSRGCYLGFNVGENDTLQRLSARLGLAPAVFVQFYAFPLSDEGWTRLDAFFSEVRDVGGLALVTLEPFGGLETVSSNACWDLANFCAAFETQGIAGIMIRFAHEMNGSWYPWGQQPILYTNKFRLLAQAIHQRTSRTALIWAPNHGAGYPFPFGGPYRAQPGTPDFAVLDTDGDGVLTQADDMYGPYYPGDDVVDWVGMTLYHWGVTYPWLENELPLPNSFARALTGNDGELPDFYARFCADGLHNKPLIIPETSAFYNTQQPGANEFAIKQAWWQQVFNISGDSSNAWDVALHFPKLKCINWFDHLKIETEARSQWIDWRVSACALLRDAFLDYVRTLRDGQPYFLTAPEVQRELATYAIVPVVLPQILPLTGNIGVTLQTKTPTACDLAIDLLDESYQWQGGTRVLVAAGLRTYSTSFGLVQPLKDGATYRWSIFLTPTGGTWQQALAWHRGPRPVARALSPSVQILNAPPVWLANSNLAARVRYTVATNAWLHLNLLDSNRTWRAGRSVPARRTDSVVEITLDWPGVALENGWLEALLSDSAYNRFSPMARSALRPIRIEVAPSTDQLDIIPASAAVLTGDVVRVLASYSAVTEADLIVELLDSTSNQLARAVQPVPPGSSALEMTVAAPQASPGTYRLKAWMSPPAQPEAPPRASAPIRSVEFYSAEYRDWTERYWGTPLSADPTAPSQDADSDSALNYHEFAAGTDPRNASSVLKLTLRTSAGELVLQWPTVTDRNYRLIRSTLGPTGPWQPIAGPWPGTGSTFQFNTGLPIGPQAFWQVEAFRP